MTQSLNPTRIPWPFWCLALAWLCANLPSTSHFEFRAALKEFRHFSHQAELSGQALALLQGEPVSDRDAVTETKATHAPEPALPGGDVVKKIQLSLAARSRDLAAPLSEPHVYLTSLMAPPEWMRDQPPHPPPKDFWVS